jgi:hypothetical protein
LSNADTIAAIANCLRDFRMDNDEDALRLVAAVVLQSLEAAGYVVQPRQKTSPDAAAEVNENVKPPG